MVERARPSVALAIVAGTLAACATRAPRQMSVAHYDAIRAHLEAQSGGSSAPAPPAAEPRGTKAPSAAEQPAADPFATPPRDDAERRRRVAAALPADTALAEVATVGDGTRWVVALARGGSGSAGEPREPGAHLLLVDVSRPTGLVVGEHDFGTQPAGDADAPSAPGTIRRTLLLDATPAEPLVLAELATTAPDGAVTAGACGWSLARRRWTFVCAPRATPTSRWEVDRGQLVETWTVDPVGGRIASGAGTRSGRVLRWSDGAWRETDSFRCLGRPLAEAFREAGGQPLATWQHAAVRRLTQSARRASASLETDTAIARLRDALAIDGCAPEVWRVLGRLEFEAGRPDAVATLAVALALAPRDDAALLDLADALAVLDLRRPGARDRWHTALAVLESRTATRALADGPGARDPRALALALYGAFLDRTSPDDEWLAVRRRKVEEKAAALQDGQAARR